MPSAKRKRADTGEKRIPGQHVADALERALRDGPKQRARIERACVAVGNYEESMNADLASFCEKTLVLDLLLEAYIECPCEVLFAYQSLLFSDACRDVLIRAGKVDQLVFFLTSSVFSRSPPSIDARAQRMLLRLLGNACLSPVLASRLIRAGLLRYLAETLEDDVSHHDLTAWAVECASYSHDVYRTFADIIATRPKALAHLLVAACPEVADACDNQESEANGTEALDRSGKVPERSRDTYDGKRRRIQSDEGTVSDEEVGEEESVEEDEEEEEKEGEEEEEEEKPEL
ncbi:hypothetical protein DIPPA_62100, partial [Diplonema papillatum]